MAQRAFLVVVTKDASDEEIDKVVAKVRYLFSDDPLAAGDDSTQQPGFCSWYNFTDRYPEFRAMVEQAVKVAEQRRKDQQNARNREVGIPDEDVPKPAMTATLLGRLEQSIANMDLTNLVRRQPICALLPNMPPKVVFNELYVSITELRRKVMPDARRAQMRLLSLLPREDRVVAAGLRASDEQQWQRRNIRNGGVLRAGAWLASARSWQIATHSLWMDFGNFLFQIFLRVGA